MNNSHSIFWSTKGGPQLNKVCDLNWAPGKVAEPTTLVASRPLQSFDFKTASDFETEEDFQLALSEHCKEIDDLPEATFEVVKRELPSNVVFSKICRNDDGQRNILHCMTPLAETQMQERTAFLHQCETLVTRMAAMSSFIQFDDANLKTFGDEIRNSLILNCTEVEAISKSILRDNGSKCENVIDFFKLEKSCLLSQYEVQFTRFPNLSPICPFAEWGASNAHGSLSWYRSYNNSKHDRLNQIAEGNLANALFSMAGVLTLIAASYGWPSVDGYSKIQDFVSLVRAPTFDLANCYMFERDKVVEGGKGRFVPRPTSISKYPF